MKLRLRITAPSSPAITFEHGGPTVCLGRDPACQLVLDNNAYQQVSWRHARVELTPQGAFLSDLESTNGTFVNGKPANGRTVVRRGDEIGLGKTGPRLKLLELDLKAAPAPAPPRDAVAAKPPAPVVAPAPAPEVRKPAVAAAPRRQPGRQEQLVLVGAGVFGVLLVLFLAWMFLSGRAVQTGGPTELVETTPNDPVTNTGPEPSHTGPTPIATKTVVAVLPREDLGGQAMAVFKQNCQRCHGQDGSKEGGVNYIMDRQRLLDRKKVIPGKPDESKLLKRVVAGEMPPEDEKPRPTEADVLVLRRWIEAGAPATANVPTGPGRQFIGDREVLTAIRDHLRKATLEERRFKRYYTLTHLYNNATVPDADLPLYRAAFAKLINSLSWKERIVVPEPVDAQQTVYCVDLRDIDWDRDELWRDVVANYPYGLIHDTSADDELRKVAQEVYRDAGTKLPLVRIDWLVATASRPPLYHTLLRLPDNARKLETDLGVDVADNFVKGKLRRSGFTQSGVSGNNRLVERHVAKYGAYWKSYDFGSSAGRGNLFQFPLGPSNLPGQPFPDQAFTHDGGEIIFNLPNGLQGYLLIDGSDKRIDVGPVQVVSDTRKTSGTQEIVNGLSCMVCHAHGMIVDGVKDLVRDNHSAGGKALVQVRQLYPERGDMNRLLEEDEQRFTRAMERATGGLSVDALGKEPIGAVAGPYRNRELDLAAATAELGVADTKRLRDAIANSKTLIGLGLAPLTAADGTVKREAWEKAAPGSRLSVFQEAARELRLGEAFSPPETKPAATPKKDPQGHPGDLPS